MMPEKRSKIYRDRIKAIHDEHAEERKADQRSFTQLRSRVSVHLGRSGKAGPTRKRTQRSGRRGKRRGK